MFSSPFTSMSAGAVSAGALLGTAGTNALLASINDSLGGSSFFGTVQDTYRVIQNSFVENIVRPIQQATATMANVVNILMNPDSIRPIVEQDQLKAIPPCMQEPIIMFPPVRALLEQGRISGFGYNPEYLPKEDVWGRLIENGVCRDVVRSATTDDEGRNEPVVFLDYHWESTDPAPSYEELDAVEMTRDFILNLLENTTIDPTDYPFDRG